MSEQKKNQIEKSDSHPAYLPPVDIYEKNNVLVVAADMPGVDEKDVNIDFEKGVLTIKGQVKEQAPQGLKKLYGEYKVGNYQRSFSVPEEIDVEKISASVKNGVVLIELPRSPKPEARKIPVKVE